MFFSSALTVDDDVDTVGTATIAQPKPTLLPVTVALRLLVLLLLLLLLPLLLLPLQRPVPDSDFTLVWSMSCEDGGSTLGGAGITYGDAVVLLLSCWSVGVAAGVFLSILLSMGVDGCRLDADVGGIGDMTAIIFKIGSWLGIIAGAI